MQIGLHADRMLTRRRSLQSMGMSSGSGSGSTSSSSSTGTFIMRREHKKNKSEVSLAAPGNASFLVIIVWLCGVVGAFCYGSILQ